MHVTSSPHAKYASCMQQYRSQACANQLHIGLQPHFHLQLITCCYVTLLSPITSAITNHLIPACESGPAPTSTTYTCQGALHITSQVPVRVSIWVMVCHASMY